MYNKERIHNLLMILANSRDFEYNKDICDYELGRALKKATTLRNCSVEELQADKTDYTDTLISMVTTAIQLSDKLGMTMTSQNGVANEFESGSCYLKEDLDNFIPLGRGAR